MIKYKTCGIRIPLYNLNFTLYIYIHAFFFISNTFISNTRLKLA